MSKCATEPCPSCPYRKDTPKGIWVQEHYEMLSKYDGSIFKQACNGATAAFGCHLNNGNLCRGWLDCHGAENLLAVRLMNEVSDEMLTPPKAKVYESGAAVLAANLPFIEEPPPESVAMMSKIQKVPGKFFADGIPTT